jgi:conjugal transfer ATP-binding protein TraC
VDALLLRKKEKPELVPSRNRAAELFPVRKVTKGKTRGEAARESSDLTGNVQPIPSIFHLADSPDKDTGHELGTVFFCLPLSGLDNHTDERLLSLLNTDFPAGTMLSLTFWRSPDIFSEVNHIWAIRHGNKNPNASDMNKLIAKRTEFLERGTQDPIENRTGTLVVTQKLCISLKIKISGSEPTKDELHTFKVYADKLYASLDTAGLNPDVATGESYLRFMQTVFNWKPLSSYRMQRTKFDPDENINDQILDFDTVIQQDDTMLSFGDGENVRYAKMLSAKKNADIMYFGDALAYVGDLKGRNNGIKENYLICTNIYYPDHETTKKKHNTQRTYVVNQAGGPLVKLAPVLGEKYRDFNNLNKCLEDGNRPIEISYHIGVFGDSPAEVEQYAMSLVQNWKGLRFDMMTDISLQLPILINSLPLCADMNIKDLQRYKPMTTKQAMPMLPIFGEWNGTGTPHMTLFSRNGAMMSLSMHDSGSNYNFTIAATSGSGKSFVSNYITESYLSEGGEAWIIDVGRSYEKLCSALNGDFIHFGEGSDVCLNPFPLIKDWNEEEDAIIGLLAAMAAPTTPLNDWQTAVLKQVAQEAWNSKGNDMSVDLIAEMLIAHPDQRAKDIGQQMYAFTSQGAYGKYFNGPNNVTFRSSFNVLELEELKGRSHLQRVVLFQLIYQIQQAVFMASLEGRKTRRMILIDEAWDMLNSGSSDGKADPVEKFIESFYRRARKYGAFIGICTQSLSDLFNSRVGHAIHENSATTILLRQKPDTIKKLETEGKVAMTKAQLKHLETVHTIIGVYSEMMILSDSGTGIARLFVSDYQKLLYSTKPEDVAQIAEVKKAHNCSDVEAIEIIINERQARHQPHVEQEPEEVV